MGMSSEVMIFVPIGITLAMLLGLDKVTGTAMIALGAAIGFTAGILNPFNVGVAQDIAELPLFFWNGLQDIYSYCFACSDKCIHHLLCKKRLLPILKRALSTE